MWIAQIRNLGDKKLRALLDKYQSLETIYNLTKFELMQVNGIGEETAKNILNRQIREKLEKQLDYMKKSNIEIISIQSEYYPQILRQIYNPPIALYVKGNKEILNNNSIGIVGCRNCTEYGKKASIYFAENLAKQNLNIVSGLAKGVDSYAHIGTLNVKGKTIAVLGNGLDIVYPKENFKLVERILEAEGTLISEYPIGEPPNKNNFPARNRIISGLVKKLLVIEAKKKSGTLITVDFALEQGKDVYVVPGNINSLNSIGTNDLIKQGANVATTYEDLLI